MAKCPTFVAWQEIKTQAQFKIICNSYLIKILLVYIYALLSFFLFLIKVVYAEERRIREKFLFFQSSLRILYTRKTWRKLPQAVAELEIQEYQL